MKKSVLKKVRLLKSYRCYSTAELADELGVHSRTVQTWRKNGLHQVDGSVNPYLFMGHEAKRFLFARRNQHRCKLGPNELYCPRCKSGRLATSNTISKLVMTESITHGFKLIRIRGECSECSCQMNRFGSEPLILPDHSSVGAEAGGRRLLATPVPASNTDLEGE